MKESKENIPQKIETQIKTFLTLLKNRFAKGGIHTVKESEKPAENKEASTEKVTRSFDGLQLESGERIFDSPNPTATEELTERDTRVTYFRFRIPTLTYTEMTVQQVWPGPLAEVTQLPTTLHLPTQFLDVMDRTFNSLSATENLFSDFSIEPLQKYLAIKYTGKNIGIRGTATAITSTPIFVNDMQILTPTEILARGVENGKDHALMTAFKIENDRHVINHRSRQWLTNHPAGIRHTLISSGKEDQARDIFPVVLIYDRDAFEQNSVELPTDPTKRAQVILEAIVLDMPLPYSKH